MSNLNIIESLRFMRGIFTIYATTKQKQAFQNPMDFWQHENWNSSWLFSTINSDVISSKGTVLRYHSIE